MIDYYFFDKRYFSPIKFNGELFKEIKTNKSNIKIFTTNDNLNPFVLVFFGNNTEVYTANSILKIFYYLEKDQEAFFKLINEFNLLEEYTTSKNDNFNLLQESFKISLYQIEEHQILTIVSDSFFKFHITTEITDIENLAISDWLLRKFQHIKYDKLQPFLRSPFQKDIKKKNRKYLNSPEDGDKEIDTHISSIRNEKKIYVYGEQFQFLKNDQDGLVLLITSKNHHFLIINDKLYKDTWLGRLLLLLPLDVYIEYFSEFNIDKKYHILLDESNNPINKNFIHQLYKQVKIPLDIKSYDGNIGYSQRETIISELLDSSNKKMLPKCHFHSWYVPDGSILNKDDHDEYSIFESSIHPDSYPIYTNSNVLLETTSDDKNYFLLKINSKYNSAQYILIIEQKNNNEFYMLYHPRILYFLASEGIIPFSLNDILKVIGIPTTLDSLGTIITT